MFKFGVRGVLIGMFISITAPAMGEQTYIVKSGDSLSSISREFYGDTTQWLPLLNANRALVREQGSLIFPGTTLRIPDLGSTSYEGSVFEEKDAKGLPILSIVTGNDYKPFTDESLPEGGMFTEIVKTAAVRAGYSTEVEYLRWDYALKATKKSTFLATFPWFKTNEREKSFWYSRPVYDVLIMAFFAKGAPIKYENIDSLNGLRFCRPKGYFLDDVQAKIDAGIIEHVAPKTPTDCFKMLLDGDVDVVSVNEITGIGAIRGLDIEDKIVPAGKPVSIRSLHVIFPKFNQRGRSISAKFDEALEEMENDETIQKIIERHLTLHYESSASS